MTAPMFIPVVAHPIGENGSSPSLRMRDDSLQCGFLRLSIDDLLRTKLQAAAVDPKGRVYDEQDRNKWSVQIALRGGNDARSSEVWWHSGGDIGVLNIDEAQITVNSAGPDSTRLAPAPSVGDSPSELVPEASGLSVTIDFKFSKTRCPWNRDRQMIWLPKDDYAKKLHLSATACGKWSAPLADVLRASARNDSFSFVGAPENKHDAAAAIRCAALFSAAPLATYREGAGNMKPIDIIHNGVYVEMEGLNFAAPAAAALTDIGSLQSMRYGSESARAVLGEAFRYTLKSDSPRIGGYLPRNATEAAGFLANSMVDGFEDEFVGGCWLDRSVFEPGFGADARSQALRTQADRYARRVVSAPTEVGRLSAIAQQDYLMQRVELLVSGMKKTWGNSVTGFSDESIATIASANRMAMLMSMAPGSPSAVPPARPASQPACRGRLV